MPNVIDITKRDGNKAYAGHLFIESDTENVGIGTVFSVTVLATDADGTELLNAPVEYTTTVEYTLYEAMRDWAKAASAAGAGIVNVWASETGKITGRQNVIPVGDAVRVALSLPVFTPVVPDVPSPRSGPRSASIGTLIQPDINIEQKVGTAETPACVAVSGLFPTGTQVSVRIDTDVTDPVTVTVVADGPKTADQIAQLLCDAINQQDGYQCETQDGKLYIQPRDPATAVGVGAAGIVFPE